MPFRARSRHAGPAWALALAAAAGAAALLLRPRRRLPRPKSPVARKLDAGAAMLATSVLADSALEHYRGGFYNRAMYVAPAAGAATLATAVSGRRSDAVYGAAALTGLAGFGFHLYNIARQPGGLRWNNLFYGAPFGAPFALHLAGLLGAAARRVGPAQAPALALGTSAALLGTVAEAALLHFRGAFQDPFMVLPVTVPPAAALALAGAALGKSRIVRRGARLLLQATATIGLAGVGFHAWGVSRNMGGWRNWSQNVLNGPPLPAPPAFTGLGIAGLAALDLLERR